MSTKKIFKATLFIALTSLIGFNVYEKEKSLSDLAKANVEALASGESGSVKCCPDPGDECKLSSGDILEGQDEC